MAYGIIYKLRAETQKYKDDIKINILKLDYAGTQYDKYLGAGGVTLTKDDAGVICGTSMRFTIQADTDFEYIDFFESAPLQYRVDLYVNDELIWTGFMVGDEYREEFKDPPYDVSVTATDRLGLLKNHDYTIHSTDPETKTTRIDAIREILENTGLALNIRIAYDLALSGVNLFSVEFSDDYFNGWDCYSVLERLIPPDATITQSGGVWLIRRNERDSEGTHSTYSYIEGAGYVITTGAGESVLNLAPMGGSNIYPIGTAELSMRHAWSNLTLVSEHGKRQSMLQNHDFADDLTAWTEVGTTGFVATYQGESGTFVKITGAHGLKDDGLPTVSVKQSIPFESVDGEDFIFRMKYSVTGYLALALGAGLVGKKKTEFEMKGRIEFNNGTSTYYLNQKDGWNLSDPDSFGEKAVGNIVGISWKDFAIYANNPPNTGAGTLTITLYGLWNDPSVTEVDVNYTDVVVTTSKAEEYPGAYRYEVAVRENATENGEVTILPTDAPDVANFNRIFYTGQTVSDEATTGFVNAMINSLVFLHGVTRQVISGSFRGPGLGLNSVLQAAAAGGRKYTVASGEWDILSDRLSLDLLEIPGSASGSTWVVPDTDYDGTGAWDDTTSAPSSSGGSSTVEPAYSGGGSYVEKSWFDEYFEIVNPGTTGEFIRALRDFASTGEIVAYNTVSGIESNFVASFLDLIDTPDSFGTSGQFVVVNAAGNGLIFSDSGGGSASGVSDHGLLSGLGDDDHPHYFNQTRGDARYQFKDADLTSIAALRDSYTGGVILFNGSEWSLDDTFMDFDTANSFFQRKDADLTAIAAIGSSFGFLKKTAANTWGIDPSVYLTAETDPVFAAASGSFSTTGHNHNSLYLGISAKAADSDKLDGQDSTYFAVASHNHNSLYLGISAKAADSDKLDGHDSTYFAVASHNHSGVYEPAFSKNTAFNKNFGSASGDVCQGNDARLSDSRTPLSHTHGNLTNDGKIGVVSGKPIITTTAGALTAGSFGTTAGTFAAGNDSRFHTHANSANLAEINQDLGTGDDVHFLSADVTSLEVDQIIDGVIQTGYGANLLKYSSLFENEVWDKVNCTASDNNADNPFGGNTLKACYLMEDSTSPVLQQEITNSTTGVHVFSIWVKSAGTSDTVNIRTYSNTQSVSSTPVSVTTSWQRVSVTLNFTAAHAKKYARLEMGTQDLYIWGAQLEAGSTPTRHINTGAAGASETGAHVYGDLRVAGSIVASDDVTAYSDARLKHDITPTSPALDKLRKIEVVDYNMNGDRQERRRTGVIAQQILPIFPQMVEGNESDYYTVNYPKLVTVAIKAIQELTEKVERLEKILKENGITHD